MNFNQGSGALFYLYYQPFMYNLQDWYREESRPLDWSIVVGHFGPLHVNVETTTDVSPHNDIFNI